MAEGKLIFVTGYFGAPIQEEARSIASCKHWRLLDLDAAIEKKDGRSVARLCMMSGEHAYRNAEYEMVAELCGQQGEAAEGLVVACGDGILYDDETRALILQHELVIAGEDRSIDELWAEARQDAGTYHAFMKFGTEEEKRAAFEAHHQRQRQLFARAREEAGKEAR